MQAQHEQLTAGIHAEDLQLIRAPLDERALYARIKDLRQQQVALLYGSKGVRPREGSKRRDQYDALADRVSSLQPFWLRADEIASAK